VNLPDLSGGLRRWHSNPKPEAASLPMDEEKTLGGERIDEG